jgi:exo-1,4-beta-D-glucosaminidase
MEQRLGKPDNMKDYLRKAQYLNYEGMRAMYEAFEANRFKSTGIIQWMYNASWPKLWWQLYDYYLMPTGAFYGAKKANEPLHISYNYGKNTVDIINNTDKNAKALSAKIMVFDFNMKNVLEKGITLSEVQGRKTVRAFNIPEDLPLSKTYFIDLKLYDRNHQVISTNFYVLSIQKDSLDESKSTWYVTPESQYADLKMLQELPPVKLDISKSFYKKGGNTFVRVKIKNPSSHLAFMIHLDLKDTATKESVVPIFWEENYITLLPGEERMITGYCHTKDLKGGKPAVTVDGWNIKE